MPSCVGRIAKSPRARTHTANSEIELDLRKTDQPLRHSANLADFPSPFPVFARHRSPSPFLFCFVWVFYPIHHHYFLQISRPDCSSRTSGRVKQISRDGRSSQKQIVARLPIVAPFGTRTGSPGTKNHPARTPARTQGAPAGLSRTWGSAGRCRCQTKPVEPIAAHSFLSLPPFDSPSPSPATKPPILEGVGYGFPETRSGASREEPLRAVIITHVDWTYVGM